VILQPTIHFPLPVDTTDYPLYRLSALLRLAILRKATTSKYSIRQALSEAASRIIKLGERENLTLDKLLDALRVRSLSIKDAGRMSQVALLKTKGTTNSGSAESSVAAPPVVDTIADEKEDSKDEK
jgi:hypothetical protein